jgi:DNA-binding NtrC family response regulator
MQSPDAPVVGLIEDDPIMGESIVQWLTVEGYRAEWWRTGAQALAGLRSERPNVIVCDIRLPDMSGEDIYRSAPDIAATTPIVFITGYGEIDQAVRLVRAGAADYLTKPFEIGRLLARVKDLVATRSDTGGVLGRDPKMLEVERLLRRVALLDSSVLITGESGVGKEVAARFLHTISPRSQKPFMAVNCAAIPAELIESELFGHEKGAFTGAVTRHEGYAERARDGILFLDEVCDLPFPLQSKLLRLVQERTFFRLGGERRQSFAARLVCATNADPKTQVEKGLFRPDLYYRINVIRAHVPPLRARPDDVLPLTYQFFAEIVRSQGSAVLGLTTLAEEALVAHDWPGNVRELRNRIERAVALTEGSFLSPGDVFPEKYERSAAFARVASLAAVRDAAERREIVAALEITGGDVTTAAERLGVSRSTLFDKIKRLGLGRRP